jgi:hypothetical protein
MYSYLFLALHVLCIPACPCLCCMFMLHVHDACPCCISLLHVHGACPSYSTCPSCMSILNVHASSSCCTSVLHVRATCTCYMSVPHEHVNAVFPGCMPMFILHVISLLHVFEMETCMQGSKYWKISPWGGGGISRCHLGKEYEKAKRKRGKM